MLIKLFRYIFGYYKVSVSCDNAEKLLDILMKKNVCISGLKKTSSDTLSFECSLKSLTEIKNIKHDSPIDVTYKKFGLFALFERNKNRCGLIIGLLIFCISFYFISLHIWHIEIIGCNTVDELEIISFLEKNGIKIGTLKSDIDVAKIENNILYSTDKLSWMSINIKGTMAYVEIRENECKVKKLDTSKPSNIYASRDGVIRSVKTYMGYPVVKPGDTVTAGELLITGDYTDKYGKNYKLHSYGEVMANTVHSFEVTVPYIVKEQQKTGKSKKYYKINTTRLSIPLYFNKKILYNNYSKTSSVKKIKLFDSFYLPLNIKKTVYYETDFVTYSISKQAALEDAYQKLDAKALSLVGIEIIDKRYDVVELDDGVTVKLTLDCYENICFEKNM